MTGITELQHEVDGIPVLALLPDEQRGPLAIWLSHLGGSKEQTRPVLERLAAAGLPAVSLDPVGHGARAQLEPTALMQHALGAFRARMWPLLGQTTIDALAVLDWASERVELGLGVVAGGVSMGGDVAVALAGIEPRVRRVAAIGSTPDWSRPGMTLVDDPTTTIDQGTPSPQGAWWREQLDPLQHRERFADRPPRMLFTCGAADSHVPPDGAARFRRGLPEDHRGRVEIELRPGLDHLGVCLDPASIDASVAFLTAAS